MADFNDLNKKASAFAANAALKAKDLAVSAAGKAKSAGRIARLNLENAGKKDIVRKAYADIGKLYYETHKDAPEGFFVQLCEEIGTAMAVIDANDQEIAKLKEEFKFDAPDFDDADFDAVVTDTEEAAAEEPEAPAEEPEEPKAPSEGAEAPAEEPEAPAEEPEAPAE